MPAASLLATGVTVHRGGTVVLDGVDLTVTPGSRTGVVGPNGVGKSTLLRVLAGELTPDEGRVVRAPSDAVVGLLPQEPSRRPGETVRAMLRRRTGVGAAEDALDAAAEALGGGGPGVEDAYQLALDRYLAVGAADLDVRLPAVAADVGLAPALLDAPTAGLSGGQLARVSLASLLLARFDVLLLDEPTNDLDFAGLARLERYIREFDAGFVVVSHDRELLARSVTDVVELDEPSRTARTYAGGWEAYLAARDVDRRQAREAYESYAETRTELVQRAQRQRERARSGALRAVRKPPDPDRAARAARVESATAGAAAVRATETRIARLGEVEEPRKQWQLRMTIAAAPRAGAVVATLSGAVVERGAFRLGPVSVSVGWAQRVAVTGANGSGKSTLLAALLGRLPLAAGRQALGPGVVVGEVDQARGAFLGGAPLVESFAEASGLLPVDARTLLAKFGLGGTDAGRPAATLSAGERTRAALALLQARGVNTLVLDEPTNHLDLPAIEQLEQALAGYEGTLLLVTHDRRMLDAVHLTRELALADGTVTDRPLSAGPA